MNEPSVFDSEEGTFPLQNRHYKRNGTLIKHRDVRNAYGAMMHKTTHQGVLERNSLEKRSFVLTRSFFIGSQKYGPHWTGDNIAINSELKGAVNELLSNGIAGQFFGGADIPGFVGDPT